MGFETFFGNESLKTQVLQRIQTNTLPNAIILEGEKGIGKKTFARLMAAALLCQSEAAPCLSCSICKNVMEQNHPDVLYYQTEKHTKDNFKIETVRQIRKEAYIMPNQSAYKIFILDEADLMNAAAQNALLKILEEPPGYAKFILLSEKKSAFLETILSRCTVYRIERVNDAVAVEAVQQLLKGPTREEIEKCVALVGGNIGLILDGLRGNEMMKANEVAIEIAHAVVSRYEFDVLKALAVLENKTQKQTLYMLAQPLKNVFRDALALRCGTAPLIRMNETAASALADALTKQQLLRLMEVCDELRIRIEKNMNQKLLITWLCVALRTAVEY